MAGMKFVQLNFAPKIALDDLWEIPLEVVFLGRFEQVITFLQYLKSFDRALRIDELQITQSGEKGTGYFCLKASVFSLLE